MYMLLQSFGPIYNVLLLFNEWSLIVRKLTICNYHLAKKAIFW